MGRLIMLRGATEEITCVCHGDLNNLNHFMRLVLRRNGVVPVPKLVRIILVRCDLVPRFLIGLRKKIERLAHSGLRIWLEAHVDGIPWRGDCDSNWREDSSAFNEVFQPLRCDFPRSLLQYSVLEHYS
jgi:hypothetical protein